jgi:zinc/manganese transport system ATP-binding protein
VRTETISQGSGERAGGQEQRPAAVSLRDARLAFGTRVLWSSLDLDIAPGEFVAVLGPNGSGKTSLLRVLLGMQQLSSGTAEVAGVPAGHGNRRVGYIPQRQALDSTVALRGRDLVGLGLDGHRWGVGLRGRRTRKRLIEAALHEVEATGYANRGIGMLSGGEQQRLRVAQSLIGDPEVLLCDEPLLSLDLAHQRAVSDLIDKRRRSADTAVVFVTHEINPVLPLVDRVLYLVDGRFRIGTPDEVMTSETLSELYRTEIEVLWVRDQIIVVGASGQDHPHHFEERQQ